MVYSGQEAFVPTAQADKSATQQHTPGPWSTEYRRRSFGGYAQEVFDSKGEIIATAAWYPVKLNETTTGTNREANACLIAAAPDLLDALHRIANPGKGISQKTPAWAVGIAKSAITKATGAA